MPPKGLKKLKRKTKKENVVTSRLMAISLLVDDYIYKNKTISLLEAQTIDKEITLLKLKCKDPRSLQVVEKLKSFMRSIIKEQSIDRIQEKSSSIVTEPCIINNPSTNLNVIPKDAENNITNTTTKLFSTQETENSEINNNTQDCYNQKKISKNIANPVIGVSNSEIIPINIVTTNTLKLNNKSEKNDKNDSKNYDFDKDNNLANPTNEKEQAKDSVMLTSSLQKPTVQEKQNIQENQNSNDTNGTKNAEKQTKANKKTRTETTTNKNIKTKAKKVLSKEPEKKTSSQSKNKPKEKSQINFSWVENIKFVREVGPDEHTELQIDDNFWSNLTLPGSWDSNDFY